MDTNTKSVTVKLAKVKDCNSSVRFDVPKNAGTPEAISNIYVNRIFTAINGAQEIEVTITVLK